MFTRRFWASAGERAVKSAAQALVLLWGGDQLLNAWQMDWRTAGGIAAGAVVLSVLTSLASARISGEDSPSLAGGGDR